MKNLFSNAKFGPLKTRNQQGVSIVDALGAMALAGMMAAGTMSALSSNIQVTDVQRDAQSAVGIANSAVEKTLPTAWNQLGFLPADVGPNDATYTDTKGTTYKTVVLQEGVTQVMPLKPDTTVMNGGQEYNVHTELYWEQEPVSGQNAGGYGTKHIQVTVSWLDRKGEPRQMTVGTTRTPNIGEAIPYGLSEHVEPAPEETTTAPEPTTEPSPEPTPTEVAAPAEPTPSPTPEETAPVEEPTTAPEPTTEPSPTPEPTVTTDPEPEAPGTGSSPENNEDNLEPEPAPTDPSL